MARFANDGTIYASRVTTRPEAVVIDHLVAPDRVIPAAVRLPFTVKATAPHGYCPIDGYLATFAINTAGLVLEHHLAGPWDHSCPDTATKTTEANGLGPCTSPEAVSPEVRTDGFATEPRGIGAGTSGGMENIVSDARVAAAFAGVGTGGLFVVRPARRRHVASAVGRELASRSPTTVRRSRGRPTVTASRSRISTTSTTNRSNSTGGQPITSPR